MQSSSNRQVSFKPESSEPYMTYVDSSSVKECKKSSESAAEQIYLNVGVLSEVKGSAYMEYENSKVLSVVFPPQEPTKFNNDISNDNSLVHVDVMIAPFATRDTKLRQQNQKSLAIILKKALDPIICRQEFSTFKVCVYVVVLEYTEHIESTAFNCCIAALAEGGIPIYDLYASSTSVSKDSSADAHNKLNVFSKDISRNQVTNCFQKGYTTLENFKKSLNENLERNEEFLGFIRTILMNKLKKTVN